MKKIVCSFFGHRVIVITEELKIRLLKIIEDLIVKCNVQTFLFGSKSMFDDLCYEIVTCLKETKYPSIKRIFYSCSSEACYLEKDRKVWEEYYKKINKKEKFYGFEENFEHKTKFVAGKASYVERNYAMINDSDYCVFYYNQNYKPQMKKQSNRYINNHPQKSGTAIAYAYAKHKKKFVINTY